MKYIQYIFSILIFLAGMSSCTPQLPEEEDLYIHIDLIGLYPAENGNYSLVLTKSTETADSWDYIDSLLFVTLDTAGRNIGSKGLYYYNRPFIRSRALTVDNNILLFGNMNTEAYSGYYSTKIFTPGGDLVWDIDMPGGVYGISPAQNGDLFVFGRTNNNDISYSRISLGGDTLWHKLLVDTSRATYIQNGSPSSDNGCFAIGYTRTENRGNDILSVKINQNGDTLWTGTYGGDLYDDAQFVTELKDGSVLVVGKLNLFDSTNVNWQLNSGQQIYLIKLSANGDKLWTKAVGNTLRETANAMIETADGSLVLCGTRDQSYAYLFDAVTGWICKLSADGEELWLREFENKLLMDARELPNGDLLVAAQNLEENIGSNNSQNTNIMKFNSLGTLQWNRVLTP